MYTLYFIIKKYRYEMLHYVLKCFDNLFKTESFQKKDKP